MNPQETQAFNAMRDALESIALAGMSGTGQESEEAMTEWHARRAWEFIGIAARAITAAKEVQPQAQGEVIYQFTTYPGKWVDMTKEQYDKVKASTDVRIVYLHPQASEPAPTHNDLVNALAECRDLVPVPPPGVTIEAAWREAIADPLAVPALLREYLELAAAPEATK